MTGRVLLTGASGFLGKPVLKALGHAGFEIHAVTRATPAMQSDETSWHMADLLDLHAREALLEQVRPTHLVHLAWYVEHGKFWAAPENETWRAASLDLVRAFARQGGKRAVLVGTCAEYDWARNDTAPWRESDPCRPATIYGKAKHALHQALEAEAPALGLSFAWARLFLMFGQGEDRRRLVPSLIDGLLAGRPVPLGRGDALRDFCDIQDIADALAALLAEETITGAVNVASGRGVTIAQVAELLVGLTGASRDQLQFGALPPRNEPSAMVADTSRLRDELGFTQRTTLEQRLREEVALRR